MLLPIYNHDILSALLLCLLKLAQTGVTPFRWHAPVIQLNLLVMTMIQQLLSSYVIVSLQDRGRGNGNNFNLLVSPKFRLAVCVLTSLEQ